MTIKKLFISITLAATSVACGGAESAESEVGSSIDYGWQCNVTNTAAIHVGDTIEVYAKNFRAGRSFTIIARVYDTDTGAKIGHVEDYAHSNERGEVVGTLTAPVTGNVRIRVYKNIHGGRSRRRSCETAVVDRPVVVAAPERSCSTSPEPSRDATDAEGNVLLDENGTAVQIRRMRVQATALPVQENPTTAFSIRTAAINETGNDHLIDWNAASGRTVDGTVDVVIDVPQWTNPQQPRVEISAKTGPANNVTTPVFFCFFDFETLAILKWF